jgi:integrase
MGRPRKGSVIVRPGGGFAIRITLNDGGRSPEIALDPTIVDRTEAERIARETNDAELQSGAVSVALGKAPGVVTNDVAGQPPEERSLQDAPADVWAEAYFADRAAHGKGVRQDKGRWFKWISPVLGKKPMSQVDESDAERLVEELDEAIMERKEDPEKGILEKTAAHIWGVFTSACKAACRSKNKRLRVRPRDADPTRFVLGPERGPERQCGWIYPCEASQLYACEKVPLRWRQLIACAIGLYVRPGEMEALAPDDFDFVGDVVVVHRAVDRSKSGNRGNSVTERADADATLKGTKTNTIRRVPIEPSIRPLLTLLVEDARRTGRKRVFEMPPWSDLSEGLRTYLRRAGVTRDELFANDRRRRPIRWYDCRSTGITWRARRNDAHLAIQYAAGHTSFETTEGYIKDAGEVGRGVGEPFPELPAELLVIAREPGRAFNRAEVRSMAQHVARKVDAPSGAALAAAQNPGQTFSVRAPRSFVGGFVGPGLQERQAHETMTNFLASPAGFEPA